MIGAELVPAVTWVVTTAIWVGLFGFCWRIARD